MASNLPVDLRSQDLAYRPKSTLSRTQAQRLTDKIKRTTDDLWALVAEAHEALAWAALGYTSWGEYVADNFSMSRGQSYELLDRAYVIGALTEAAGVSRARDIAPVISGRKAGQIKSTLDAVAREVADKTAGVRAKEKPAIVGGIVAKAAAAAKAAKDPDPEPEVSSGGDQSAIDPAGASEATAGEQVPSVPAGETPEADAVGIRAKAALDEIAHRTVAYTGTDPVTEAMQEAMQEAWRAERAKWEADYERRMQALRDAETAEPVAPAPPTKAQQWASIMALLADADPLDMAEVSTAEAAGWFSAWTEQYRKGMESRGRTRQPRCATGGHRKNSEASRRAKAAK